MNANALMIAGWLLLAGVIVQIIGDRSAGGRLLAGAAVLIASRVAAGIRPR